MAGYKSRGSSTNFFFNKQGEVVGKNPEAQQAIEDLSPALQACYDKACELMDTTHPGECVTWEEHIEPTASLLSPLEVEAIRFILHL